ncbi:MAG: 5-bromo-4-chloroindolyl phosphate hydrolysis family protein [Pseudomonadota bacterium]
MSAKRFGGKHSPGGPARPAAAAQPARAPAMGKPGGPRLRAFAMFVLPSPILLAALGDLGDNTPRAVIALACYVVLMLAAWLLREGLRAEAAFDARQIAKPPAFPRKLCAAILTALGVSLAVFLGRPWDILSAGLSGILALIAHISAFGLDPMKSKGVEAAGASDFVIEAIDKAEARVAEITRLAGSLRDREITGRVGALMERVREMLRLVEEDPRDLARARRYFTVYLKGAEDATRKYVGTHAKLDDPELRGEYLAMLGDLEESFARGRDKLLSDDRTDLEVEIEVLRERLGQESA